MSISPFEAEENLPEAYLNDITYRNATGFIALTKFTNAIVNA